MSCPLPTCVTATPNVTGLKFRYHLNPPSFWSRRSLLEKGLVLFSSSLVVFSLVLLAMLSSARRTYDEVSLVAKSLLISAIKLFYCPTSTPGHHKPQTRTSGPVQLNLVKFGRLRFSKYSKCLTKIDLLISHFKNYSASTLPNSW